MARHRSITTAALAALALCVPAAAAHASSTLLSGYGGPGQGNQALIGSTLVGAGGKGGGGGAARPEASSSSSSAVASPASIALPSHPTASRRSRAATPGQAVKPARVTGRSRTTGPAYSQASVSLQPSGGGGPLGLTGSDVAYIALALTVLVLTALLTARVAGRAGRADGAQ